VRGASGQDVEGTEDQRQHHRHDDPGDGSGAAPQRGADAEGEDGGGGEANSAAVPTTMRRSVSAVTGFRRRPWSRSIGKPRASDTAAAASPATKATEPITIAFAASTWARRGQAPRVVRISPRRYSAVTNMAPI